LREINTFLKTLVLGLEKIKKHWLISAILILTRKTTKQPFIASPFEQVRQGIWIIDKGIA